MKNEKYIVGGMTCSACSARVEKCVSILEGVEKVSVNLLTNSMQISYDDSKINSETIINTVINTGYTARLYNSGTNNTTNKKSVFDNARAEIAVMKKRLIWSIVFLLPMMYIAMHGMLSHMFSIPVPYFIRNAFDGTHNALISAFTQFLLLLPILYLNRKYYINGFKNIVHRSPNMDSLIALGSGAALIYGIFAIYRMAYGMGYANPDITEKYASELYFESAGMIVTLITLGKYFESKSKGKTSRAIEKLMDLAPKTARVERGGKEFIISIDELVAGDIVAVKPGESIAADGIIIYGSTSIDESAVTGESIPVQKHEGDNVVSATLNKNGFIKFRAVKVGEDSTINQIIKLVDEASASKAPIAKLADKVSGIFVPVVVSVAVLAMFIWLLYGAEFEFALSIGISVLVISCPCALGLATPVAIMVGTGKGAQSGILIKSGEALETAHSIDTVVLDKTGTITEGKPAVTDIIPFGITENYLTAIAAGMEKNSEHPLADAIVRYAEEHNIDFIPMTNFNSVFGRGITAVSGTKKYFGGNAELMNENGIMFTAADTVNKLADEGKTPIIFAENDKIIGIIAAADVEKADSGEAIRTFAEMGIDTVMLTGDNERTAKAVCNRLGIKKFIAGVLPADKEKHIVNLQNDGHKVAMIGDGINDSPALARADVGIAIGAGTDIAIESADIVLMHNNLLDAVNAVKLSKAVIRTIKQNLFWAFFYNSIGIPIAAGVLYPTFGLKLSPMIGAAAMSFSSVFVVGNALRLRFFKGNYIKNDITAKTNIKEETIMNYELTIEGMMCEHCKKRVEDILCGMDGVTSADVVLDEKKAYVKAEKEIDASEFEKVITDAGYKFIG